MRYGTQQMYWPGFWKYELATYRYGGFYPHRLIHWGA